MDKQQITVLRHMAAQARSADMDIGLSANILTTLLGERENLIAALRGLGMYAAALELTQGIRHEGPMITQARAVLDEVGE
jgi:hypothetical protein